MRSFVVAYVASMGLLVALAAAGGVLLYREIGPDDPAEAAASGHAYDLIGWEMRHFPEKWLAKLQHLVDGRSEEEANAAICEYFEAEAAERPAALENEVEEVIEGRVTAVLEDEGLPLEPPLFSDLGLIFPPVDFELDTPPRLLAVSPRDRIELRDSYLLEPKLSGEAVRRIEEGAESENNGTEGVSALVIGTGGFSSYPSVVFEGDSYDGLIETVFHEWLHSYLISFPLGASYFGSDEARTLNESVANIAGKELAKRYLEKHGSLEEACGGGAPTPQSTPSPSAPTFDFTAEMRALRREVEAMLADGRIQEAEALMAAKRDEFETKGVFIRRLNQAYFAFQGFYADSPGSIDPIGPKLQTLLERAGSVGEFVRAASGITTRAELDAAVQ